MIKEMTINEIDMITDFSWDIHQQPQYLTYPIYETKEQLRNGLISAINHKEDKVLACFEQDDLLAVLRLNVEENNHYLQSSGLYMNAHIEKICNQFFDYIKQRYQGFELYIGLSNQYTQLIQYLVDNNLKCNDDSYVTLLKKENYKNKNIDHHVVLVEENNFDEFTLIHDRAIHGMDYYWTSQRIKENKERWAIYIYKQGNNVIGYVLLSIWNKNEAEIYSLYVDDIENKDEVYQALLHKVANHSWILKKKQVLFFIDFTERDILSQAKEIGFEVKDQYKLFKMIIKDKE